MSSPHPKSHRSDTQPQNNIIDADPDPNAVRAAQIERENEEKAEFAQAEAQFAIKEHDHGEHLMKEGKDQEGVKYAHDATLHMRDAKHLMDDVARGDAEVESLREDKRRALSLALRDMPDQHLETLRDAVTAVRAYVEDMSELDVRKLSHIALLPEDEIERKRQILLNTGVNIEITLNAPDQARRNPYALVRDLMTFTTVAMEFATHLPKLLELLNEFGRILFQYHF